MKDADRAKAVAAAIPAARAFNKEVAPAFIDHVCLSGGFAPPPGSPIGEAMGASFTYCELHSASAATTTLLAASNPMGDFHAIDPRAEMVAAGRAFAKEGGVRNLTYHQGGIEAAMTMDLPQFDYVIVHGVYSWVPLRERAMVLSFLRKFLKPGGAVYVTYGAKPGGNRIEPFRRLFREVGRGQAIEQGKRLAAARGIYKRLGDAKARSVLQGLPAADVERLETLPANAIAADYANDFSDSLWVTEVVSDFAAIDCVLAGTADMAESLTVLMAHEPFKSILEKLPTVQGRELAKDMLMDTSYRRDVFVRGGRRLAADSREAVMGGMAFALEQPVSAVRYRKQLPFGEITFDNPHAKILVAALATGPRTLGELIEIAMAQGTPAEAVAGNVHVLLLSGQIRPVYRPSRDAVRSAQKMSEAVRKRALTAEAIGFLPTGLGTAFAVPMPDQLFMNAGEQEPVEYAEHEIEERGQTAKRDELEKRLKVFRRIKPYYASLGIG